MRAPISLFPSYSGRHRTEPGRFALSDATLSRPATTITDFAMIKDTALRKESLRRGTMDISSAESSSICSTSSTWDFPSNILTGFWIREISKTAGTSRQIQISLKLIIRQQSPVCNSGQEEPDVFRFFRFFSVRRAVWF